MTIQGSQVPPTATRPEIELPDTRLFIGGEWRDPADGGSLVVVNPATEEAITEIAVASAADVDAAVAAARRQFDGGEWSRTAPVDRGRLLYRLADLVERDVLRITRLEALEIGKPVTEAASGHRNAVDTLRYFAGWADKIDGRSVAIPDVGGRPRHSYTVREPVGVVAALTPWNGPVMISTWKLAAALAAGCTVVLKPPEDAPLGSLHLAGLIEEAGFPPGTVNVVPGIGEIAGAALVRHPGVDKISFTGSPEVGREIAKVAADTFKRLTVELGGKSPLIFFSDADLDQAIPGTARAFTRNAGQVCSAATRLLVESRIADELVDGLASAVREVRVGDPFDQATTMGALINSAQLDRVLGYVDAGVGEGAELVTGGVRLEQPGYFVEPTVFRGRNDMKIAQEEIFGPVATVIPFDDIGEAVRIANDTRYGLAAGVWTRDLSKAHIAAAGIRAGSVYVNGWGALDSGLPHGGFKTSGIGRERGPSGLDAFLEEKAVTIQL
jgi:acyl-CoA reductase-like NAD-dependent aldehyde dehydrogenase